MTHSEERPLPSGEASGPSGRPARFVAAVIYDEREFEAALDELVAAGIPRESLGVLHGERGAAAIANRRHRWLNEFLSDETRYVEHYAEEIRQGGRVVGVPLPNEALRDRVTEILRAHGARDLVSSGRWAYSIEE